MIFDRQKQMLALLDALGGQMGNLDFQKLLFLYCSECDPAPPYEFVPFRYGGFSFTSYADRRKLVSKGLLKDDDDLWELTPEGRKAVARVNLLTRRNAAYFAYRHRGKRGDALVAEVYRRYPYYAINSVMAPRLLAKDPEALRAIEQVRPAVQSAGLLTIGYEGHSLESYLNLLIRNGATILCDVRRNPISRKYGFSKNTLSHSCEGLGIRYEHRPNLGIATDARRDLKTQSDYDALFAHYERVNLPRQSASIREIGEWIAQGQRVALTCYEHLPQQCHRRCVADAVMRCMPDGSFSKDHL